MTKAAFLWMLSVEPSWMLLEATEPNAKTGEQQQRDPEDRLTQLVAKFETRDLGEHCRRPPSGGVAGGGKGREVDVLDAAFFRREPLARICVREHMHDRAPREQAG